MRARSGPPTMAPAETLSLFFAMSGTPAVFATIRHFRRNSAVDHGHLESNPAIGKRRCLKAAKPRPVHPDSAEQIALLLEAAGQLDRGEAVIGVSDSHGRTWTQRAAVQTTA